MFMFGMYGRLSVLPQIRSFRCQLGFLARTEEIKNKIKIGKNSFLFEIKSENFGFEFLCLNLFMKSTAEKESF